MFNSKRNKLEDLLKNMDDSIILTDEMKNESLIAVTEETKKIYDYLYITRYEAIGTAGKDMVKLNGTPWDDKKTVASLKEKLEIANLATDLLNKLNKEYEGE